MICACGVSHWSCCIRKGTVSCALGKKKTKLQYFFLILW